MTTRDSNDTIFKQCLARCQRADARLFVVLAGEKPWCASTALELLAQARAMAGSRAAKLRPVKPQRALLNNQSIWIADDLPESGAHWSGLQHVHRVQAQRLLGSETSAAVIDAHDGLNANTLAAVTGTLCGGGLFILLTPPLDAWPGYADPDAQRIAQAGAMGAELGPARPSLFLTRMVRYLRAQAAAQENILVFEQNDRAVARGLSIDSAQADPVPVAYDIRTAVEVAPTITTAPVATAGQQRFREAAAALCRRPAGSLLVTAARGRGKSTALAFAVFDALQKTTLDVVVVAPHRSNVALLFSTLQALCSDLPVSALGRVRYRPADALLQEAYGRQSAGRASHAKPLLVVDEAAGLALSLLEKLDLHHPRKILASTTHGYEGSGQGLLLRFAQRRGYAPSSQPPNQSAKYSEGGSGVPRGDYYKHLSLTQPIRWAEGDQLESFIARLLCLADSHTPSLACSSAALDAPESEKPGKGKQILAKLTYSKLVYSKLDKAALLHSESLLQNVYGLLVEAHYQTQPNDLRFILDTPYSHLWLARDAHNPDLVTGVLLAVEEGGLRYGDELTSAIVAGKRRPRGNLVAQRLANFSGQPSWCALRSLRVMRIAVAAGQRRHGIASRLLESMGEWAGAHDFAYWSSSFGFREELADFWQSVEAAPVYLGMHLDKSSGARNLMVANPLSSQLMAECTARASANLAADLRYWYPRFLVEFSDADCGAIARWAEHSARAAAGGDAQAQSGDLGAHRDLQIIARFAAGELDIAAVLPALARLAACNSGSNQALLTDWPAELADYIACAPNWRELAARTGVSGQAALSEALKRICFTLVQPSAS